MSSGLLLSLLLLASAEIVCCRPTPAAVTNSFALQYLSQFGYLDESARELTPQQLPEGVLFAAIADFQAFAGLNVTGLLDEETAELMRTPRCGVKDVQRKVQGQRRRRFVPQGSKWKTTKLTYRVNKYSERTLDKQTTDTELARAFNTWTEVSPLQFKQKANGTVTFNIRFERLEHGDGQKFDGKGNTLAHAFFPRYGGDVHFDDDEQFTSKTYRGTNLFQTAVHEYGHALGLSHSDVKEAQMAPFYHGYQPNYKLHKDDIDGIQSLYGMKNGSFPVISTTPRPAKTGKRNKQLCNDPAVDAIFTLPDGSINVIKGTKHYLLADGGVVRGYPKAVKETWPDLPAKVDAAVTYKGAVTFFFGDKKVWGYINSSPAKNFPMSIATLFGASVPERPDAVFEWSGNGKMYFFKGDQFWCFDPTKRPAVSETYPKPVSSWKGVPSHIDSALVINKVTYFFKDSKYYKFDDNSFSVSKAQPPYPRPSGQKWFGCK